MSEIAINSAPAISAAVATSTAVSQKQPLTTASERLVAAIDDFSSTIVSFDMLIADTEVKSEPEHAFDKSIAAAARKIQPITGIKFSVPAAQLDGVLPFLPLAKI